MDQLWSVGRKVNYVGRSHPVRGGGLHRFKNSGVCSIQLCENHNHRMN